MRVLSITAGAAGMYCGSCARDNALARELLSLGHDCTLVPVYTPTRTDEPNASQPHILFGGISVYLQQFVPLFRKTSRFLDRLWDAPWVINRFAGRAVSNDPQLLGDLTISMLEGEDSVLGKEFEKLVDWIGHQPTPDIINLPNSLLIALAAPLRERFDRPVCCTLQGEELFIDGLLPSYRKQALNLIRGQIGSVDRFVAVSEYCRRFMMDYLQIPEERIAVVPLGINLTGYPLSPPSGTDNAAFRVGYFARVAPEKGLHVLADAYIRLRQRTGNASIRLDAAGYTARAHTEYMNQVRTTLAEAGYAGEFSYRGVVDRDGKLQFLQGLDVLSVPATYDEPKGMFLLEAMANGVPVVQPRRGAFTEIVEKTCGGLLVDPDDAASLAEGLWQLWKDRGRRDAIGQQALAGVHEHYSVRRSAIRLIELYDDVLNSWSGGSAVPKAGATLNG